MESISVFEIIKVGIGPSSSHTMGPWNAAEMFLEEIKRTNTLQSVKEIFVEFFGSLAKTGVGDKRRNSSFPSNQTQRSF